MKWLYTTIRNKNVKISVILNELVSGLTYFNNFRNSVWFLNATPLISTTTGTYLRCFPYFRVKTNRKMSPSASPVGKCLSSGTERPSTYRMSQHTDVICALLIIYSTLFRLACYWLKFRRRFGRNFQNVLRKNYWHVFLNYPRLGWGACSCCTWCSDY